MSITEAGWLDFFRGVIVLTKNYPNALEKGLEIKHYWNTILCLWGPACFMGVWLLVDPLFFFAGVYQYPPKCSGKTKELVSSIAVLRLFSRVGIRKLHEPSIT